MIVRMYDEKKLGYGGNAYGWYTADKDEPICDTMERLGTLPFVAQPGSAWVYGYNLDVLGCVIERASGKPLDEFIRERITKPLGMNDTYFFLPKEKRASAGRACTRRTNRAECRARRMGRRARATTSTARGGTSPVAPGLLSTARDYAHFLEMLRNDGALDGHRYLAPHTVALMRTNQVGLLHSRRRRPRIRTRLRDDRAVRRERNELRRHVLVGRRLRLDVQGRSEGAPRHLPDGAGRSVGERRDQGSVRHGGLSGAGHKALTLHRAPGARTRGRVLGRPGGFDMAMRCLIFNCRVEQ